MRIGDVNQFYLPNIWRLSVFYVDDHCFVGSARNRVGGRTYREPEGGNYSSRLALNKQLKDFVVRAILQIGLLIVVF